MTVDKHWTLEERLEHYTNRTAGGCWKWTGQLDAWGYGRLKWRGRKALAHRLSWESTRGPVPIGLWVLHRCDTPDCINPMHLFLGTEADNRADMFAKGRQGGPRGRANIHAKLTEDQVRAIRSDIRLHSEIAAEYGVGESAVRKIRNRESWRHLP